MPPRGAKRGSRQSTRRSRSSTRGASSSRRAGKRSRQSPTKEQLYRQATRLRIQGRSKMSKTQLARAVGRKRR